MEQFSRIRTFSSRPASPVYNAATNLGVLALLCTAAPLMPGRLELLGVSLLSLCMARLAGRLWWALLVITAASAAWFDLLGDRVCQLLLLIQWFLLTCRYLHLLLQRILSATHER